jgi:hypothetical protein
LPKLSSADVWHDFSTFNFDINLQSRIDVGDTLWIAIDTYDRNRGESRIPNKRVRISSRAEFLLAITHRDAKLYVAANYDLFCVTIMCGNTISYTTTTSNTASWNLLRWRCGSQSMSDFKFIGQLPIAIGNVQPKTHQFVHINSNKLSVRLPWTLINFSDPSNNMVIDDNTSSHICNTHIACAMRYLHATKTSGIVLTMAFKNQIVELPEYQWHTWHENHHNILDPSLYIEVAKESLQIITNGLQKIQL